MVGSFIALLCLIALCHISLNECLVVSPRTNIIRLPLKRGSTKDMSDKEKRSLDNYSLYNENRVEYLTKIYVGSPPQQFYVTLDTGSADVWVPSTNCPGKVCPFDKFQPNQSTTFEPTNLLFAIEYGSGSVKGKYGRDSIHFGSTQQTIKSQTFGLVSSTSEKFITGSKHTASNGILGLAFPALTAFSNTSDSYLPILFNLANQNIISDPVFSIYLGPPFADGWVGELTLGGSNPDKYKGDLHYLPVLKNINQRTYKKDYTFWSVGLQDIILQDHANHTNITLNKQETLNAILDTGTTLTYLPKQLSDSLIQWITKKEGGYDQSNGFYVVDCDLGLKSHQSTRISFTFSSVESSVKLDIPLRGLVLPLDSDSLDTAQVCGWGISHTVKNDKIVLGASVLRSSYMVFDMEKKQVGLAASFDMDSNMIIN